MIRIIGGLFFVLLGLWFVIYHKYLGNKTAYWQQRFWDLFHFRTSFSEGTINAIQIMLLIIGVVFLVLGTLSLFNVIRFE